MTNYYIRKSGWDGNDGLSPVSSSYGVGPWETIAKANITLQQGDTVYIKPGDYNIYQILYAWPATVGSLINPTNAGSGSLSISYIGDISGEIWDVEGDVEIDHAYITQERIIVEGIVLKTPLRLSVAPNEKWLIYYTNRDGCELKKCKIYGQIYIYFDSSHKGGTFELENCFLYITSGSFPNNNVDYTCPIHMHNAGGMSDPEELGKLNLKHCTIIQEYAHDNGDTPLGRRQAIYFSGTKVDIRNSIIYIESGAGSVDAFSYTVWGQDQLFGDYNCYKINGNLYAYDAGAGPETWTLAQWQSNKSRELNSLGDDVDPKFTTTYELTETSPCVDGCPEVGGIQIDINNNLRPVKIKDATYSYDIGCWEFRPETSLDSFQFRASDRAAPVEIRKTPYREAQLKWVCTHYLSGTQYILSTCPRCLGKGYFYDIRFDAGGLIPQVWDETKLMQELEKITLTDFNPFHPEYGAKLKKRIGQVSRDELKAIVKRDLLAAVYNLIKYQKAEASKGTQNGYFSSRELIDRVEKVEIVELSTTELSFALYVITIHGKEVELTGKILI